MKILGLVSEGYSQRAYICEVSHAEIEKFLGLYYDKMKELKAGDVIDLGKGYDHAREIKDATKKTEEFITANKKIIEAILNGMTVLSEHVNAHGEAPCPK